MSECSRCGTAGRPAARFCARCGAALTLEPGASPPSQESPRSTSGGSPSSAAPTDAKWRRSPWRVGGAIALVVALIALLGWRLSSSNDSVSSQVPQDDGVSAACDDFAEVMARLTAGEPYSAVDSLVATARIRFEQAGESTASSYLLDFADPGYSSPAEAADFWRGAVEFGRSEGNPGLARIDEVCGRAAADGSRAVDSTTRATVPVASRTTLPPTTTSTPAVEATTSTSTAPPHFVTAPIGAGTFDEPFSGDSGTDRYLAFAGWQQVRTTTDQFDADFATYNRFISGVPAGKYVLVVGVSAVWSGAGASSGADLAGLFELVDAGGNEYDALPKTAFGEGADPFLLRDAGPAQSGEELSGSIYFVVDQSIFSATTDIYFLRVGGDIVKANSMYG